MFRTILRLAAISGRHRQETKKGSHLRTLFYG